MICLNHGTTVPPNWKEPEAFIVAGLTYLDMMEIDIEWDGSPGVWTKNAWISPPNVSSSDLCEETSTGRPCASSSQQLGRVPSWGASCDILWILWDRMGKHSAIPVLSWHFVGSPLFPHLQFHSLISSFWVAWRGPTNFQCDPKHAWQGFNSYDYIYICVNICIYICIYI